VYGIRRGWAGLLEYDLDKEPQENWGCVMPMDKHAVRRVDRSGGTFLHTSRTNPGKVTPDRIPDFLKEEGKKYEGIQDFTPHVMKVIEHLGIDCLIPIGGDDTLSYGERLHMEGIRVIAIPKTMDNDVPGTDYCIGFSTCVTRTIELCHSLRTTAGSHERFLVIEVFGRYAGFTALLPTMAGAADRCVIPESPFSADHLTQILLEDRHRNPSHYSVCLVSEGATMIGEKEMSFESAEQDQYGHKKLGGIGERIGIGLKQLTGTDMMIQNLGYLLRSGPPDAVDLIVAKNFGVMTVQLIAEGKTGLMASIVNGHYVTQPANISTQGEHRVNVAGMYDTANYRPKISRVEGTTMYLR